MWPLWIIHKQDDINKKIKLAMSLLQQTQKLPIEFDQFQIVQNNPKFTRRCAILIDVNSLILCRMIIPLIEQSLQQFDEIVLIPCTPYPTIIEHKQKIKLVTLKSSEQDYKIEFLNFQRFLKIRQYFRMIEKLAQYQHDSNIIKNNYSIELGQQIINRLLDYQQVKIIHFAWITNFVNPQTEKNSQLKEIKIGKNQYSQILLDETNSSFDYYNMIVRNYHGTCTLFNHQDLDDFYQKIENFSIVNYVGNHKQQQEQIQIGKWKQFNIILLNLISFLYLIQPMKMKQKLI